MAGKNHKEKCQCKLCVLPKGKDHWNWKGDAVKYRALHQWMESHFGTPKECEDCGSNKKKSYVWANISGEYKRKRRDWKRLCVPCHIVFDRNCGQDHYHSKLSNIQVRRIKRIHLNNPKVSQAMLARMFKVARGTIVSIVRGRNWKHIIVK